MDYHCAKFGDFGLSRFGFIVRTDIQTRTHTHTHTHTHTQTESQRGYTDHYTDATINRPSLCENYIKFGATFVCILVM